MNKIWIVSSHIEFDYKYFAIDLVLNEKAFSTEEQAQNYIREITGEENPIETAFYYSKDNDNVSYYYAHCEFVA